jgi:hypothetical protein
VRRTNHETYNSRGVQITRRTNHEAYNSWDVQLVKRTTHEVYKPWDVQLKKCTNHETYNSWGVQFMRRTTQEVYKSWGVQLMMCTNHETYKSQGVQIMRRTNHEAYKSWDVQIMRLLTLSPPVPLRRKHLPQKSVFRHPKPMLFPQCETKFHTFLSVRIKTRVYIQHSFIIHSLMYFLTTHFPLSKPFSWPLELSTKTHYSGEAHRHQRETHFVKLSPNKSRSLRGGCNVQRPFGTTTTVKLSAVRADRTLSPRKFLRIHFCYRVRGLQSYWMRTEGLGHLKISREPAGNRTKTYFIRKWQYCVVCGPKL